MKRLKKMFPFVPMPGQKTCFEVIENDMVWRSSPMDGLVCGDIGFGKTEVALRALFRAVINGCQAALGCSCGSTLQKYLGLNGTKLTVPL